MWHFDNRDICDRVGGEMVSTTIGKPDYLFTFKKHICVGEPEEITGSYTGLFQQKYSCTGVDYSKDMLSLTTRAANSALRGLVEFLSNKRPIEGRWS